MKKEILNLNTENLKNYVSTEDIQKITPQVEAAQKQLVEHTGAGNDFHGWLKLPFELTAEYEAIKKVTAEIRQKAESVICVGIGGSYLGAMATISALQDHPVTQNPKIYFAGQNMSSRYLTALLRNINIENTWLNVISKSGTTTEPGLAFRILYEKLVAAIGESEANQRIIVTTDRQQGALKKMAYKKDFPTFSIPDNVGGRFSILTPVGLVPIALAGINIDDLMAGARDMAEITKNTQIQNNPALHYAAVRNILFQKGKGIEILANFEPALHYVSEWWKQLFGESEGKNGLGIFPASADFSTDLHSMGQLIQDGQRNIFETFLLINEEQEDVIIPAVKEDFDGFNYLAGKTLAYVNQKAYEGTAQAHLDGDCPNMKIVLPRLSAYSLGQLFYFFEYAVAVSGYILGVNPFDQPGVETYKKNMFHRLGKAGY